MKTRAYKFIITTLVLIGFSYQTYTSAEQSETWKTLKFPDIKENTFVVNGDGHIDISMDQSSSLLFRPLQTDEKQSSTLKWQWKINQNIPPTQLSDKNTDDRPVAVHIWFPKQKGDRNTGFREFLGRLFGYDLPGRVITYVWGGKEDQYDIVENPHLKKRAFLIVLKTGDFMSDHWVPEQVNFKDDYEKIFKKEAPEPTHIAVSGDTDHTKTVAHSSIRNIEFIN